jgi:hypothetical protein
MSDTPIPGKETSPAQNTSGLAEAGAFDARLKAADESRWLASRYAPAEGRELLVAIYLLNGELQRAMSASEAMLGKIRVQWWREAVAEISTHVEVGGRVRRHDLVLELARVMKGRADLVPAVNALVDSYDDILDDHLHAGGHQGGDEHAARHLATGAALARLAGLALDRAATASQLDTLGACGAAEIALKAELEGADARFEAAALTARELPPVLWPAVLHLAARGGPLGMRWRVFSAMLRRRL